MTSALRFLLAGLICMAPATLRADEAPAHPLKPMLWKVEGGKLSKPSYLFGTVHLGSGPLANLHPAVEKAFSGADVVYTEIPMDAKSQLEGTMKTVRKDGRKLSESIGADLTKQLDAELGRINPQLDSTPFQQLKTWVAAVSLEVIESQMKGETAMDQKLWQRAEKEGRKTGAIETLDSQLAVFDSFKEEEQIVFLAESLRIAREDREAGKDSTQELVDVYVKGDADLLKKEMDRQMETIAKGEHKELGERLMKKVLTDRDKTMAATMVEILGKSPGETHFFAAGAAHFAGPASIRSHIEKQGYTVTRVEN